TGGAPSKRWKKVRSSAVSPQTPNTASMNGREAGSSRQRLRSAGASGQSLDITSGGSSATTRRTPALRTPKATRAPTESPTSTTVRPANTESTNSPTARAQAVTEVSESAGVPLPGRRITAASHAGPTTSCVRLMSSASAQAPVTTRTTGFLDASAPGGARSGIGPRDVCTTVVCIGPSSTVRASGASLLTLRDLDPRRAPGPFRAMADASDLTLSADFPVVTQADWRALVDKTLGEAPFSSLEKVTAEGLRIEPLYAPSATSTAPARAVPADPAR